MNRIKEDRNSICRNSFYWEDEETGYRITIGSGPNSFFTRKELKTFLRKRINKYLIEKMMF